MNAPKVPKTAIYLRDYFQLRRGTEATFCNSAKKLINFAPNDWHLIAAGSLGKEPYNIEHPPKPSSPPKMMHIWRLTEWDTLYNSMYETSELDWYMSLEESIRRESQDFLVDYRVGTGVVDHPSWGPTGPGYAYRYEDVHLKKDVNQFEFLVLLVTFAAEVQTKGWSWIWSASSVTGEQRVLSFLWCAASKTQFTSALKDKDVKALYDRIMKNADAKRSRFAYMFPIATETY